jgi:hypothetical protein
MLKDSSLVSVIGVWELMFLARTLGQKTASRRLKQRISVDLPEPDGPQMDDAFALVDRQIDVLQRVELSIPFDMALASIMA